MNLIRFLRLASLLMLVLVGLVAAGMAADPPKPGKDKKPRNRLAKERSPYLLMHAHNPVDWYPWGPEAFAKAKKEGKLIFLSIGYSSCYWCHVMERESFDHPDVAKILNDHYVAIKVDREERPDVDHIYMTALHLQGRQGGWPLSMFLTPDGRPILGGTYWPREDKVVDGETVRGFKTILKLVHQISKEKPKEVEKQASELAAATRTELAAPRGLVLVAIDRELVAGGIETLQERFDPEHGGFGSPQRNFRGTKFPTPCYLELLLQQYQRTKEKKLLEMVMLTLDKMALGGIYDHLGGGFHRYSTERTWTVPHFEKMLYDNGQLAQTYAKAYRLTKSPLYRRVLTETLAYVQREMMTPEGAFYSSQDAETAEEEGRFYVWTNQELDAALPSKEDNKFFRQVYSATGEPNFEKKYHILRLRKPLPEVAKDLKMTEAEFEAKLAPLKKKLFEIRSQREAPFLNQLALTGWSGLMIAGLAEAGSALADRKYLEVASKAADFVLTKHRDKNGRLFRNYGAAPGEKPSGAGNAYLEDYAFVVHGLLTLHQATGEKRWLDEARTLTEVMLKHHGDEKEGGYYFTANDHEKLFARVKDQFDGATPSGNSMAAFNLARLWALTGEEKYGKEAERTLKTFTGSLRAFPVALTTMLQAVDVYVEMKEKKR